MKVYELRTRVRLPRLRSEVFEFFAAAGNLESITPPWLRFRIVTPPPIEMRQGALIDYRLRLRGIPLLWKTEITAWDPPRRFVDEQLRGPYRLWIHEHTFEEDGDGTIMEDHVHYAVPFGWLADRLLVARDLRAIFGYREARMREMLGKKPQTHWIGGPDPIEKSANLVEKNPDPAGQRTRPGRKPADPVEKDTDPLEKFADPVEKLGAPVEKLADLLGRGFFLVGRRTRSSRRTAILLG